MQKTISWYDFACSNTLGLPNLAGRSCKEGDAIIWPLLFVNLLQNDATDITFNTEILYFAVLTEQTIVKLLNSSSSGGSKNVTIYARFKTSVTTDCKWDFGKKIDFYGYVIGCYQPKKILSATANCSLKQHAQEHQITTYLTINLAELPDSSYFNVCVECTFAIPFCYAASSSESKWTKQVMSNCQQCFAELDFYSYYWVLFK